MKITIARKSVHQTTDYAIEELYKYLKLMDSKIRIDAVTVTSLEHLPQDALFVGLDESAEYSELDDKIIINVKNGCGRITGANERSVLIAVYRFLRELGCRWLAPGPDGEFIPRKELTEEVLSVNIEESPSYRHRGICYEGSNVYQSVYNMIDWIPKVGMNGYFFQGIEEDEGKISTRSNVETQIHKRGLVYHAVGHAFTGYGVGLPEMLRDTKPEDLPPEIKQYLAEVGGKREIIQSWAMSQLCYSNPTVREKMNRFAVDYLKKHRDIKYLHYWLGDGCRRFCECEECKKMRPSDFYIQVLNEFDEMLTAEGIDDVTVVFLIYIDFLWEPEKIHLTNPSRFTMMFAPISRTYSLAFCDRAAESNVPLEPYVRNTNLLPHPLTPNVESLERWKARFDGDSFLFDYHLMWDHYLDPGYYECAKTLHRDMTTLDSIELNGMVSCQIQRAAFPTALPEYAMAAGLWDKNSKFEDIAKDYFDTAFGDDSADVENYLRTLSELFDPKFMRNEHPEALETAVRRTDVIKKTVEEFRNLHIAPKMANNVSYSHLYHHAELCLLYAELIARYAVKDQVGIDECTDKLSKYALELNEQIYDIFDGTVFEGTFKRWIKRVFGIDTRPYAGF